MGDKDLNELEPLVGEWTIEFIADWADETPGDLARATFEWWPGRKFLLERWEIPVPEAPDGLALIGPNPSGDGYIQHYFDTRGVARVYQMSFTDGVWKLWRDEEDFSPLDFRQRFTGTLDAEGNTITGAWDICHDGTTFEKDFDLIYKKVG